MVSREYSTTRAPLRVNRTILHRFAKDRLPAPRAFYEAELGKLTRPNRKNWAMGRCPFHASKSGRSFSVNVETGGFHCWGCDVRGGDIIDFIRLRDGLTFTQACQQLGAWDQVGQPSPPPVMVPVRYLTFDYDISGLHYSASVKDEPQNYVSVVRHFYREASDRLIELSRGDAESYIGEQEGCWARMACAVDELRELEITV